MVTCARVVLAFAAAATVSTFPTTHSESGALAAHGQRREVSNPVLTGRSCNGKSRPAPTTGSEEDKHQKQETSDNEESSTCVPGRVIAPTFTTLQKGADGSSDLPNNQTLFLAKGKDQIAHFEGIPAGATSCSFGWKQSKDNTAETFKVTKSGLVSYFQLPSSTRELEDLYMGPQISTYAEGREALEAFKQTDEPLGSMDFGLWDTPQFAGSQEHGNGKLKCAERIKVHLSTTVNGDSSVLFQGKSDTAEEELLQGLALSWKC